MVRSVRATLVVVVVGVFLVATAGTAAPPPAPATAPLHISVDAREAARHILHARLTIPVTPGALTLVYPKWIPGEHTPSGLINDMVDLRIGVRGKSISWARDAEDPYAFHLQVPAGATDLDVSLDFVTAVGDRGAWSPSAASAQVAILKWHQVLLYPVGVDPRALLVTASVRLPAGWSFATALPLADRSADGATFKSVSLETLVDSPLVSGANARAADLSPSDGPRHALHIFGDSAESVELSGELLAHFRELVREMGTLFGGYPYRHYDFLLALSEFLPQGGLEHHESSDNRVPEKTLIDPAPRAVRAGLLPHELVHSWNGKFRRPVGLVTADFQQPFRTDLLWVYEGLTAYLGDVLTARSGLWTPELARDELALNAAAMDTRPGRAWRPLADTTTAAPKLSAAVREWRGLRRGLDYYQESSLIWLEADTIIRRKSDGKRSLDDFCRVFFGKAGSKSGSVPAVVTYTLDDVLAALNAIAAYDWRGFFNVRVYALAPRAPLGGIEAGGWRLVYRDTPTPFFKFAEQTAKEIDMSLSLGLVVKEDGTVIDVLPGSPGARAGLGPGMKIIAVNGRKQSREILRAAIKATRARPDVDLLAESNEYFRTYHLPWKGGDRFPALERVPERPDLLSQIMSPRAGTAVPVSHSTP